jgi:hypothetical protein
MLFTAFTPGRDGLSDWDFPQKRDVPDWLIKPVFNDAQSRALDELHRLYFDAVEIYDLAHHIGRWIESSALGICAQEAGKLYLTLDYYAASLPLPRQMDRLNAKKAAVLHHYFDRRSLDNLEANLAGLLQALAILSLIPDAWFPEKALEKLIEIKIKQLGLFRQVEVDCQLSLPPGGMRWMSCTTLQAVEQVRARLSAGEPCLVRMMRSLERLEANRQAIVYAADEAPGGALRLEIFEPDCVLEEHALQVAVRGERAEVLEIAPPSRPLPVLGLLCDAYSPAAPPQECIPWLLRSPMIRQLWRNI